MNLDKTPVVTAPALDPQGMIYNLIKHIIPENTSDEVLLRIFNEYGTENSNEDAKLSKKDLDIMRRCYITTSVSTTKILFRGHIVETETKDGVDVDVKVNVFVKRLDFSSATQSHDIAACITREKIYYGILSEKSSKNEICKLKVTFVMKNADSVYVFVISEYCEGHNISTFTIGVFPFSIVDPSDVVKTIARKYATKFLIRLAKELLEIILWMHSNGYIYMDISPENFIVGVVAFPTTEEMWTSLFSMPRILRAIDFGALQQFDTKLDSKTNNVRLIHPIMRSDIMDRNNIFFGQPIVQVGTVLRPHLLPPYNIRSTDYTNNIKHENIFPSNFPSNVNDFRGKNFFFASSMIEKPIKIVEALYNDIHGAWLLILSLIWYCAPYYNTLLIKFIVLLRGMIVNDNAISIKGFWVDDAYCNKWVVPYLQTLYEFTENGDEGLLAIDNSADEARISELELSIKTIEQAINDRKKEQAILKENYQKEYQEITDILKEKYQKKYQKITELNQTQEEDIKNTKTDILKIKKYETYTGALYDEISNAFKNAENEPVLVGGSGRRRKGTAIIKTTRRRKIKLTRRRKTTRGRKIKLTRSRQLKNKKKNI